MRGRLSLFGFSQSLSDNRRAVWWRGRGCCQSVRVAGPGELGCIGAGRQEKPNFLTVLGILIVLVNAFADFCGRNANDRISIGIVIRGAVKDLDAEDSLLEIMSVAFQRASDYEPQELGIAFAGMEKSGGQQPFQLLLNCSFFLFAGRSPVLNDGLWYQSIPAFRQRHYGVTKQDSVASELCFQDTTAAGQASSTVKHKADHLFSLFLTVSETSEIKGENRPLNQSSFLSPPSYL